MVTIDTTDRTETRLVERLKLHFGDRLVDLLELPSAPYPGRAEGRYYVVVLQDEGYDRDRARRKALEVQRQFDLDTEYQYVTTVYVLSASEMENADTGVARVAQREGESV